MEVIPRASLRKDKELLASNEERERNFLSNEEMERNFLSNKERDRNFLSNEERERNFLSDLDTTDCYTVPLPVYPGPSTVSSLTRHQIINLYTR